MADAKNTTKTAAGVEIPTSFPAEHIAQNPILKYFAFGTLPPPQIAIGRLFFLMATKLVAELPHCAERTVALRKLVETRDSAFRALEERT